MAKKNPVEPIVDAARTACASEPKAVAFIEACRWGEHPVCAWCASDNVYQMRAKDGIEREKNYRWRCRACKKMYSVRTNTVMEETRLPLRAWVFAFWKGCAAKKGVAALQMSREMQISYRSALHLMHRVREAMKDGTDRPALSGTIEMDETYVGGKPRMRGEKYGNKRGKGTKKTQVVAMVARDGDVRYVSINERITSRTVERAVRENADLRSRFMTDESQAYIRGGRLFEGGHGAVKHRAREYARGDVHSNTIESVFAIVKRSLYGIHHSVSKHHLGKYLTEAAFKWNTRKADDGARLAKAIRGAEGKRLPLLAMYRAS